METPLYSAELLEEDGAYKLVVRNEADGTVQIAYIPQRAVDKLPYFLSLLNSRQFSAHR